jgi:isopentenyldiphosphate isomerase
MDLTGEELFDIYDESLRPIGVAPRSEVHARGHWHRSFHCWLGRPADGRLLVRFQKRASGKDTFPDFHDITVAGHLAAGETHRDAAREIREEIGIHIPFDQLTFLFECRSVREGAARGVPFIDREISRVYGALSDVPLESFRLQAEETAGIYEADARDLIALFEGRVPELTAEGRVPDRTGTGLRPTVERVTADRFVPRDASYYLDVFRRMLRLAAPDRA